MTLKNDIYSRLKEEYTNPSNSDNFEGKQSKFAVNVFQYPSDLMSPELQHYVEFTINVRGRSEFLKQKKNGLFEVKKNVQQTAGLNQDQIAQTSAVGTFAVGAGLAGTLGGTIASKFAKKFNLSGAAGSALTTAGSIVSGLAGGAALYSAVAATDLLKPDTTYRISDVIALYLAEPPTVKYSSNYGNKELGTLAGIVSGSLVESQSYLEGASEAASALGMLFAKLPGKLGATDIQTTMSATTKLTLNPFKEVIFESIDFRSFGFKYKFFPRSEEESRMVFDIIKLFKYHMHPEVSQGKLFFIYPSEFQITYYFGSKENKYFHKFSPCVLESVEITYGGEQFSSFHNGNPTEINMSLVFRETEILTKKMIDRGY